MYWAFWWLFAFTVMAIIYHTRVITTFNVSSEPGIETSNFTMLSSFYLGKRPFVMTLAWILIAVGVTSSEYIAMRREYPRIQTIVIAEVITLGIYIVVEFVINLVWLTTSTPTHWTDDNYAFVIHMIHVFVNVLLLISLIRLHRVIAPDYLYTYGESSAIDIHTRLTKI